MLLWNTWDDIRTVDDLVTEKEKALTKKLEEEVKVKCPHLRKAGDSFYYCGILAEDAELKIEPLNSVISAKQSPMELSLYCMDDDGDERYKICIHYRNRNTR
ncbi:hypothetical protein HYT25_02200 [Candidatus Pacearchaeota archaeon]|nr:hypothetical protein [Candidatus Pacearchaeota archaeon]